MYPLEDDENMPEARPEFIHLTEAEVWRGMDDAGSAVEAEVTRLVGLLTIRLMASGCGMRVRARCPIERVALVMLAECGVDVAPAH
jgi:hypothetical protein